MRKQLSVVTKTWIWIVLALTAGAATGIVSADRSRAADGSAVVRASARWPLSAAARDRKNASGFATRSCKSLQ